jgi:hypothetical protein
MLRQFQTIAVVVERQMVSAGEPPAPRAIALRRKVPMAKSKSLYGVHPGVAMVQKWIADLKSKTGRSLDEWMKFIEREGPATKQDRVAWLKSAHDLGTNSAMWLAERSLGEGDEEDTPEGYLKNADRYVEEMFAGKKAGL